MLHKNKTLLILSVDYDIIVLIICFVAIITFKETEEEYVQKIKEFSGSRRHQGG